MKYLDCPEPTESEDTPGQWNELARLCVNVGLAHFVDETDERCDAPCFDAEGRIYFRVIEPEVPLAMTLAGQTIGDRSGPPRDAGDEALAKLPITSSKRTQAAVLLLLNMKQADIIAKLRVSTGTVSQARAQLLREYDERLGRGESPPALPESVTNPGGYARRGQPRPDMMNDGPNSPMALRAADLGVSLDEARMLAADAGRIARWGERPKDLEKAAKARERRARKKAVQGE